MESCCCCYAAEFSPFLDEPKAATFILAPTLQGSRHVYNGMPLWAIVTITGGKQNEPMVASSSESAEKVAGHDDFDELGHPRY